ncbi:hypothetical protein [Sphaerisporangium rufum]|uniref:hypothetical protein n=1 Tax=Sphaerisporangium rufum TaxID=1381558 RepID=UPI0019505F3B|nr:hypothetical protein [Sphaerisporangium rufum]
MAGVTAVRLAASDPARPPAGRAAVTGPPGDARAVWPQAVYDLPDRTPDGHSHELVATAGAGRVVLAVHGAGRPGTKKIVRLDRYDRATGEFTTVARLPAGAAGVTLAAADRTRLAWAATERIDDDSIRVRFWTVPPAGGTPVELGRFGPVELRYSAPERLVFAGDGLVLGLSTGGVVRVPLDGGRPAVLPGSEKLRLLDWPWATTRTVPMLERPEDLRDAFDGLGEHATRGSGATPEAAPQPPPSLVNLETGATRPVSEAGLEEPFCGPTRCVGRSTERDPVCQKWGEPDRPHDVMTGSPPPADVISRCRPDLLGRLVARGLDGSGQRPLRTAGLPAGLLLDRFAVVTAPGVFADPPPDAGTGVISPTPNPTPPPLRTPEAGAPGDSPITGMPGQVVVDLVTGRPAWVPAADLSAELRPWWGWADPATPGRITVLDLSLI